MKCKKIECMLSVVSVVFSIIFAGCSPAKTKEPELFVIEFTLTRAFHPPIKVSVINRVEESTADLKVEIYSSVNAFDRGEVERIIKAEGSARDL